MRVMLVNLHLPGDRVPSLSLACLKAFADAQEKLSAVEITVHDWALDADPLAHLQKVHARQPHVLGLSCYTWNMQASLALCRQVKAVSPGLVVVLGGPQVAPLGDAVLRENLEVDYVVTGEGEVAFSELLRRLMADGPAAGLDPPPGVCCRRDGNVVDGGPAQRLDDLDAIPSVYEPAPMPVCGDTVYYETSRGCPNRCAYCCWGRTTPGAPVRYLSRERIFADLDLLARRGVRRVYFCDASLCLKRDRAKAILGRINEDETFEATSLDVDAAHLDPELVELLLPKVAELLIGVQTIQDEALALCRRRWNRRAFEAMVKLLVDRGVPLTFQLMYGLPGDSHAGFLQTLDYLWSFRPKNIQCFHLQVLPGTHFWRRADELGLRHDPAPPHYLLACPGYPLADVIRSREVDNLVRRLCYGFCWPAVPWVLAELGLSLSQFVTALAASLRQRKDSGPGELLEEMELWPLDRERAVLGDLVSQLCLESPEVDMFAVARLTGLLDYHYWLRRTRAAGPDAEPVTRRFTHEVIAMAARGKPGEEGPPGPGPCEVTFANGVAEV